MGDPMVHVSKEDGTTSSCGDYAVQVPHYPIPLQEGIFLKLHGGQLLNKWGSKNTYKSYRWTLMASSLSSSTPRESCVSTKSSNLLPLNQICQKDQEFKWSLQCEEAFNKAKDTLLSSGVLVH